MSFDVNDLYTNEEDDLTVANIRKRVSEIVLWRYYIGHDFKLNVGFNAPHRIDESASFALKFDSKGRLVFKDFSTGHYGDIFQFLQVAHNITFIESLWKVNVDFGFNLVNRSNSIVVDSKKKITQKDVSELKTFEKSFSKIHATVSFETITRKYNQEDGIFWTSFGITGKTLLQYNTYAVQHIKKNGVIIYTYSKEDPCYAYFFPKTQHVKYYFPKREKLRFFGNVNNLEDIQGYWQCDIKREITPDKLLVLTKSMKDVMLLREFGIDAISLHGEGHRFEKDFIRHIKKYYPIIISLYDRDKAGIMGAKALWKDHKISPFFIPKKYKVKDISDMYMTHGKEEVQKYILYLLNQIYNLN